MTDFQNASEAPASRGGGAVRPLLWVLLAISAAGNMVTSGSGAHTVAGIAFGVATLGFAIALVVHHYRTRRR
ncbi:hypothetical protein [Actinomadura miaoliensis]|uniref:Uncharacterized protein n=1 Tax=Actinomadura miaoliensis TaxID=430685 RepID=A0ABP7WSJ3_9ACTN